MQLDPNLRRIVVSSGIKLIEDPTFSRCATELRRDGYCVRLGTLFLNGTPEQQHTLLLHELGHIVRGDCLQQGIEYPKLFNIAADSQINETLDHEITKQMDGILYEGIRQRLRDEFQSTVLPHFLPGARIVYEELVRVQPNMPNVCCDGTSCDPSASRDELERAHVAGVINLREALPHLGIGRLTQTELSQIDAQVIAIPGLTRLLQHVRQLSVSRYGHRTATRTYSRPGRVPGLRGHALLPKLRVAVAIDCSGSVSEFLPLLRGAAMWLSRGYLSEFYTFDTECRRFHPGGDLPSGGGTAFQPVWDATQGANAIVMLTDGYASDITPLPEAPVIWVITKSGQCPKLRSTDRYIALE